MHVWDMFVNRFFASVFMRVHTSLCRYLYLKALCVFVCVWDGVHRIIAVSSLTPLLALTLLDNTLSFCGNPSIHLHQSFYLFLHPYLALSHSSLTPPPPELLRMEGEGARDAERDDPVFFNPLLVPSSIHLASKLNNNTSITRAHTLAHTQTRAHGRGKCRVIIYSAVTEKANKVLVIM